MTEVFLTLDAFSSWSETLALKLLRVFFTMGMSQSFVQKENYVSSWVWTFDHQAKWAYQCHLSRHIKISMFKILKSVLKMFMNKALNLVFDKLCVHQRWPRCSRSYVGTLTMLRSKCHAVSSLFSILNMVISMSLAKQHCKLIETLHRLLGQKLKNPGTLCTLQRNIKWWGALTSCFANRVHLAYF